MAVVSDDHAGESYNVENSGTDHEDCRYFLPEEIEQHNSQAEGTFSSLDDRTSTRNNTGAGTSFWACIDGFVVDATDFIGKHPGGTKKLFQTNDPDIGPMKGVPFNFSFSRGRNAHFPGTARAFQEGVERFLSGGSPEIVFPSENKHARDAKLIVLGRLRR